MKVDEFNYFLPEHLIAQHPLEDRTASRLMVVDRERNLIQHRHFPDLIEYMEAGDVLVLNDTRVIPARLFGVKLETGARIEFLLLKDLGGLKWQVLARPAKRLQRGSVVTFGEGLLVATVLEVEDDGARVVQFQCSQPFYQVLDQLGEMPLPPYIKARLEDSERYQTVYSKHQGSAAAPTAGLHFTAEFLRRLEDKGVRLAYITLHVGLGTFRPVQADTVEKHHMHAEYYRISQETVDIILHAKTHGKKIVAVGTTVLRTLEAAARHPSGFSGQEAWTDIFIYPGFQFKVVDRLVTNFHLPKSTLLMLVSALAGRERILEAYHIAVESGYRFFSFGDAMMIL